MLKMLYQDVLKINLCVFIPIITILDVPLLKIDTIVLRSANIEEDFHAKKMVHPLVCCERALFDGHATKM